MADTSRVTARLQMLGGAVFAREAKAAGRSLKGVGTSAKTADVGLNATARGSNRAATALDRVNAAGRRTRDSLAVAGRGLATIGTAGGAAAAVGLYQAGKATVEFDAAMRNVNSIAKLSEGRFQSLSKSVVALGGPTAQQPKVLAEGLYDLVSSGFNAADSLKILKSSANAATAGLTTTEVSTKAVAAVLNAYHLKAGQAATVSDQLFQVVNRGVITFPELATTIGDVLPFASSLGVGLNQVGASLSTMTKEGLSGAEATTRVKNVMVKFLKPGKDLSAVISKTGFSSGAALVKAKGFQGALEAVSKEAGGSKSALTRMFGDIRAAGGALALTGKNAKSAHADIRAFANVRGVTDGVLREQSKSLTFQWHKLKAEATGLGIAIGHHVVPVAARALGALSSLASSHGAVGQFTKGLTGGARGTYSRNRAEGGAGATTYKQAPVARRAGAAVTSAATSVAATVKRLATAALPAVRNIVTQVFGGLKPAMPFVRNVVIPLLEGIGAGILTSVVGAFKVAIPVVRVAATALGWIGRAAKPLRPILQGIGFVIGAVFGPGILGRAAGMVGELAGALGGRLGGALRVAQGALRVAMVPIRIFGGYIRLQVRVVRLLTSAYLRAFTTVARFAGSLTGAARKVAVGAVNMIGGVIHVVETLPGRVASLAARTGSRLVSGIAGSVRGRLGSLISFFARVGKSIVTAIANAIKSAPGAITGAITSIIPGKLKGAVKSIIPGLATGGVVRSSGLAVVGERGPELLRLPRASTVYDHAQTRAAMGSRRAGRSMPAMQPMVAHVHVHPQPIYLDSRQIHAGVRTVERAVLERT